MEEEEWEEWEEVYIHTYVLYIYIYLYIKTSGTVMASNIRLQMNVS